MTKGIISNNSISSKAYQHASIQSQSQQLNDSQSDSKKNKIDLPE